MQSTLGYVTPAFLTFLLVPAFCSALIALALALDLVVVPHVLVALLAHSVVHGSTEPCAVKLLSATAAQRMAEACGRQSKWMGLWPSTAMLVALK